MYRTHYGSIIILYKYLIYPFYLFHLILLYKHHCDHELHMNDSIQIKFTLISNVPLTLNYVISEQISMNDSIEIKFFLFSNVLFTSNCATSEQQTLLYAHHSQINHLATF